MNMEAVFRRIDDMMPEYIEFWKQVCELESPTADKAGIDACGRYFLEKGAALGWTSEMHEEAVSGNPICLTMNPDAPGAPVVASGHIDTVHPVGLFGKPAVHLDGDRIAGPGVMDCKGGCVAGFMAMAALQAEGFKDRPLKLVLQTDEEVSSRFSERRNIEWMGEMSGNAAAFLNTEPGDGVSAVLGRKGILRYVITVFGRSAHASACWLGANAIQGAARIIPRLTMIDRDGLTFSVDLIEGGTAGNTVPEKCSFTVDIRYTTDEQREEADRIVRTACEDTGVEGTHAEAVLLSERASMPPSELNDDLLARINAVNREAGLPELAKKFSIGGSDAAYMTRYGIPTVDSLGVQGFGAHSPDEYALIGSLAVSAKQIAAIMANL